MRHQPTRLWPDSVLHWGGLFSLIGGAWWFVMWILYSMAIEGQRGLSGVSPDLFWIAGLAAWLLFAIAVTSLWLHLGIWGTENRVLLGGFIAALLGIALVLIGMSLQIAGLIEQRTVGLPLAGGYLLAVGIGILGFGMLRFKGLPRWNFVPLVLAFATFMAAPFQAGNIMNFWFCAAWIVMGYTMWPRRSPVDHHPERRRWSRPR